MNLGPFSLSLAVKDIEASYNFYRSLGFEIYDDHLSEKWIILRNGDMLLGLFQGMFEDNILTFHPADLSGVRSHLAAQGIGLRANSGEGDEPAKFLMLTDPDGNQILIDEVDPDYKPNA